MNVYLIQVEIFILYRFIIYRSFFDVQVVLKNLLKLYEMWIRNNFYVVFFRIKAIFFYCVNINNLYPVIILTNLRKLCPQQKFVTKQEVGNLPTILAVYLYVSD